MKVTGIVAEYNPFHNGHIHHLQQVRELTEPDVIVAVMSGNFVQRGEFACIDKWARTRAALNNGVDLVVELPFAYATQSATQFGARAIDILAALKVNDVVFGSETNNLEELKDIASCNFNIDHFKENLQKGYSYPASYGWMSDSYGPNDILAISYLRELEKYPDIRPHSIKRTSGYLDDSLEVEFPSGTAIRRALKEGKDVSIYTPMAQELSGFNTPDWKTFYPIIRTLLLTSSPAQLQEIFLMDEGIENMLAKNAYSTYDWDEFINRSITRRYTRSRIQRTLCQLLVHNTRQFMKNLPDYDIIRVLGFNSTGQNYLKFLQEAGVRIANHFTANIKPYRDLEFRAAVAYSTLAEPEMQKYICQSEISGLNL